MFDKFYQAHVLFNHSGNKRANLIFLAKLRNKVKVFFYQNFLFQIQKIVQLILKKSFINPLGQTQKVHFLLKLNELTFKIRVLKY